MSKLESSTHFNQNAYDKWSGFYDSYPNPTVAIDDIAFPKFWKDLTRKEVGQDRAEMGAVSEFTYDPDLDFRETEMKGRLQPRDTRL